MQLLINAELGTTDTDAFENVHNHSMELDVIDGAGQTVMAKVTGATMIGLTTRTTHLSIVQYAHARIKQAPNLGLRSFIGSLRGNLHDGTTFNLLRGKDAELDAHDGLDIRRMLIETGWHSVLEGEVVVYALDSVRVNFMNFQQK